MLSRVRKLYRSVVQLQELPDISAAVRSIDSLVRYSALSPIDRHLVLATMKRTDGLFHPSYDEWRVTRINKLLDLYGVDYFSEKAILEVGGGHGDIGAFLADLGASVLCLEGRRENVHYARLKHRSIESFRCLQFDLENDFSQFGKFDLIINFGLLYHLRNVDEHLKCCFGMSDDILLETVVCDSTDPHTILVVDEDSKVNEESLSGTGSRPSPFYIERIADENDFEAIRYFNADLNVGVDFLYDWEHRNDNALGGWKLRRFWRLRRKAASGGRAE